ncbi:hypothetical protein L7F22_050683 [Adiantum nelumboides]|nr:hypothetical protein [Adiantum nelumboides]
MTEKLASGFLKPFLNHLRAVEEQVIAGRESVKLERPQAYHGRSWFTKGTLERFVRFVSTPEVLERVKFIEDEFAQLEQVRSIQASSLLQVEESYSIAGPVYQRNGGLGFSGPLGTFAIPKLAQSYPYDAVESHREASRVELLRAMDVRLLALRQEQSLAFSRAAAAGFSSDNMTDLIAFSEYFGADRLRMACFNFLVVLQQRVIEPNPQAVSISCGTSVNVSESNEAVCPDGLKLLGPPEKIRQDLSADQNRTDSTNMEVSAEAWQAHPAVDPFQGQDLLLQGTTVSKLSRSLDFEVSEALSANDPISSSNLLSLGGSTFESERPIKCQELSLNQAPALVLPSNQICSKFQPIDGSAKKENNLDLSTAPSPVSAPVRRLSVQDVINLFENKQRRESVEVPRKLQIGIHESGRASLDGLNVLSFACIGPRRWSIANSNAVGKCLQENFQSKSDHFSSSLATGFESPLLSPAYCNASQMQYAPGPQKLVTAVSNKEPAKGFKKLLKFGRKFRAPDAATSDRGSSYTASEGDDESEDQKYFIDMHNAKGRLDDSKAMNLRVDQYTANKSLAGQSLRKTIPAPPANFKLRNDHLMGGTMLKAPKSFFSLSSFRSRGTEGRA